MSRKVFYEADTGLPAKAAGKKSTFGVVYTGENETYADNSTPVETRSFWYCRSILSVKQ